MKGKFMLNLNSKLDFLPPLGLTLCILSILGATYSSQSQSDILGKQLLQLTCSTESDCPTIRPVCAYLQHVLLPAGIEGKYCIDCSSTEIKTVFPDLQECKPKSESSIAGTIIVVVLVLLLIGGIVAACICCLMPGCAGYKRRHGQAAAYDGAQYQPGTYYPIQGPVPSVPASAPAYSANNDFPVNDAKEQKIESKQEQSKPENPSNPPAPVVASAPST